MSGERAAFERDQVNIAYLIARPFILMIKLFVETNIVLQKDVVYPPAIAELDRAYSGEM